MKAIILDGFDQYWNEQKNIEAALVSIMDGLGYNYEHIKLIEKNIKKCNGCFSCWVKTPGECIVKDDSQEICKKIVRSDLIVFFTPVVYGGYSSTLKKMIDKIIPIILPFFGTYSNEVHHIPRYNKYPSIFGVGIQRSQNADESVCFKNIVSRNSLNFHSPETFAETFPLHQKVSNVRDRILQILTHLDQFNYAK